MEVLTAFVREHAKNKPAKPDEADPDIVVDPAGELAAETLGEQALAPSSASKAETPKVATDIQAILTVIGRRKWVMQERPHQNLNLSGANLCGADLMKANLGKANLSGANLREANLGEANLRQANLWGADLSGANLIWTTLSGAILLDADLSMAILPLDSQHIPGAFINDKTKLPFKSKTTTKRN
jgi:hypothetical protein